MGINLVRTVAIPVTDPDRALDFYVGTLGLHKRADVAMEQLGGRWIEVAPSGAGTTLALVPAGADQPSGVPTGVRLQTDDATTLHSTLRGQGIDVDDLLLWEGVPPMFEFRDPDGNGLVIVEAAEEG